MGYELASIAEDLVAAELGDFRLTRRLCNIAERLAAAPGASLPGAMQDTAELEAVYRFLGNPRVSPEGILEPHYAATADRASAYKRVLVIQDTSECEFRGQRQGLGRAGTRSAGFFLHVGLVVEPESGRPLGLLGAKTWTRFDEPPSPEERKSYAHQRRSVKESNRWREMVREVQPWLPHQTRAIYVADREGDQFRLYDEVLSSGADFIIRVMHKNRVIEPNDEGYGRLYEAACAAPGGLHRTVELSARDPSQRYTASHPRRSARMAQLKISTTQVAIRRSWAIHAGETADSLVLNLVRVFEPNPPPDEEPIEWILATSLPVDTPEEIEFIVDSYRLRWLVEEFFKAIKTGCRFEEVQLESATTLVNLLAILLPVAWRLLLLRHLSRSDAQARDVLTPTQLQALRILSRQPLSANPSAREALLAIASVGGHIKNNGDPGWLVLYRGFKNVLLVEKGVVGKDVIND